MTITFLLSTVRLRAASLRNTFVSQNKNHIFVAALR